MDDGIAELYRIVSKIKSIPVAGLHETLELSSLDLDSLDVLEVVMEIEDAFSIELDPATLANCKTLADVMTVVSRQ